MRRLIHTQASQYSNVALLHVVHLESIDLSQLQLWAERPRFVSSGAETFLFATASRPNLWSTQHHIQLI